MSKDPDWLPQAREFCRDAGIKIMAWGPETLVVETKSPEARVQIAHQLRQMGFKAIEDEADDEAGILSLSLKP